MAKRPAHGNGLNPQTEWYRVNDAATMTGRHPILVHRWVKAEKIPPQYVARGEAWPYPTLLSTEALGYIVIRQARPNRGGLRRPIRPEALRPASGK